MAFILLITKVIVLFSSSYSSSKYIGCIGINESMKSLSFEIRTQVARESIRRVAESAKLLIMPRKTRKVIVVVVQVYLN